MWYQCNTVVKISIHALLAESDPQILRGHRLRWNFYPRSPCGERHSRVYTQADTQMISIHALLAESDPETVPRRPDADISIHALLAESDCRSCHRAADPRDFYPRSPCGERLGAPVDRMPSSSISIHALLAESDAIHGHY